MNKAIVGGIVKHRYGVGFKITFPNRRLANKYKEMFDYIIKSDNIKTEVKNGYYDEVDR